MFAIPVNTHHASTFSIDDFNDDENLAVLRRCQRRIKELEDQPAADKGTKKSPPPFKTFGNMGRCIAKVVSTFGSLDSMIAENDRRLDLAAKVANGEILGSDVPEPTADQERAFKGFQELMRFIPALRKPLFEADAEELNEILNALCNGARNARSDDTKNIKTAIVPWLQKLFPNMPALDSDTRDERGIYHDDIGGLLCPTEYNWSDTEIWEKIRDGDPEYLVTADSWWFGLYPHDKFDPDHPEVGLFMNVTLLMAWKYIFTSPVSVKTTPEPDKENVASTSGVPLRHVRRSKTKKAAPAPKRSVASLISNNFVWFSQSGSSHLQVT
ncbi:hypothetical protein C8R43DRAFT_1131928 [Mycena crocata]|nr:hypothetical protein C8R43DRAFT_1131928 [Mycena crocata]